jgi:tetratricopeptide (TPR) repeat protein
MHEKAVEHFLKANQKEDAAAVFIEAGRTNPAFYEHAGQIFEDLQNYQKAIFAYALAGNVGKVIDLVFRSEHWTILLEYMSDAPTAKKVFATLSGQQVSTFIEKLPADQHVAERFAQWSNLMKDVPFGISVVNKFHGNRFLLAVFWHALSQEFAKTVGQTILISVQPGSLEGVAVIAENARALYDAKRYELAAELYLAADRHAMAGKCFALAGNTAQAEVALKKLNDSQLLQCFQAAMTSSRSFQPQGNSAKEKCHPEVIAALTRALDHVDPDSDESASVSPFSMVG